MSGERKKREFRKYDQNRRLWDVEGSKYAVLEDVAEAVEMGQDVRVEGVRGRGKTRVRTGDITLTVLLDAFHDQQKRKPTIKEADLVRFMQGQKPKWGD